MQVPDWKPDSDPLCHLELITQWLSEGDRSIEQEHGTCHLQPACFAGHPALGTRCLHSNLHMPPTLAGEIDLRLVDDLEPMQPQKAKFHGRPWPLW